ncbi:FAD dependent oxidoreductase [Microdochium bolleyi]|uniref:L-2-hydroxyglutarate dehydrogenase, mitochondrial n=1 Tax=Microdochium bolleyi TaxID=196109 RepID=A0A136J5L7_9PEZI|nr:FAD dependent oxidoreductase [Microdochium bolleyi]
MGPSTANAAARRAAAVSGTSWSGIGGCLARQSISPSAVRRRGSRLPAAPNSSLAAPSRPAGAGARRLFSSTSPARADFTHVVIGGGVVGLATARALQAQSSTASSTGSSTLLLERHLQVGTETSSRNSEVIHAGLYYGAQSLKTELCITGKEMLYDFCARHNVAHRRVGKWIVGQTAAQREEMQKVYDHNAAHTGVPLRWVSEAEARGLEPDVRAESGVLESPTTGIVDSHGLMVALQGLFEDAGGVTSVGSRVVDVEALRGDSSSNLPGSGGFRVTVEDVSTGEQSSISAETVVNCAGLGAAEVHNMLMAHAHPPGTPQHEDSKMRLYYAKGNYFSYGASSPKASRLIYPAPTPGLGGLGTHLTLDIGGRIRFGPDVEWVDTPDDLSVNTSRFPEMLAAIREYMPGVEEKALSPDYAGIRPKLRYKSSVSDGKGFLDFHIRKEDGFEGWVNLLGIESPGLTSSLAIGEKVRRLLY